MSEKRKRPGPVEEVFDQNDDYDDLMTKSFDEEGDSSDSEFSVSDAGEIEEFTGLTSDDDEENEEEEEEVSDDGEVNELMNGDGEEDENDVTDELVRAIVEGNSSDEDEDDEEDWEDVDTDEEEDNDEESDEEEEDNDEESDEKEEDGDSKGAKKTKNGRDSGIESDQGNEDLEKEELKKKTSVRHVLAQIRADVPQDVEIKAGPSNDGEAGDEAAPKPNEYEEDSSDEEDLRNTMGNIPINWYDDYPHMGYDVQGKPIIKPERGDKLDQFLNKVENPDFRRTVLDKQTGQDVRLSDGDLDLVNRVMKSKVPDGNFDMYAPWVDFFTHEVMDMPVTGRPEHKRSFIPSKKEAAYVAKRAEMLKLGKIHYAKKKEQRFPVYDIWAKEGDDKIRRIVNPIKAPKLPLPGHALSYRPPKEYLSKKVRQYSCLRRVPQYYNYIKELHERCLDLYIAPRKIRKTQKTQAKDLLPALPNPKDLRPFPTKETLRFTGHKSIIRTISIHPLGKYLASGSDDYTVKIWEISTGRCLRSFSFHAAIKWVAWNPSPKLFLLGVVLENLVYCINPETYLTDKVVVQQTNDIFKEEPLQGEEQVGRNENRLKTSTTWRKPTVNEWALGIRVVLEHFRDVKQIVWHKQGDYFCTILPEGQNRSLVIHQLSRWRSQIPFTKIGSRLQVVEFHPKLAFLYVVSQQHIRVYNLQRQQLVKKVKANSRWISSIAVHPGGEHFIIGTFDRKVNWFEMECTKRPHIQRFHKAAVRRVAFHRKYPLFASGSDDGRIIITHGMVYNDWITDPLIVPVKELKGHKFLNDLCVLDIVWHPYEPYIFSSGADATIRLWT